MENASPEIKKSLDPKAEIIMEDGYLKHVSLESIFEIVRNIKDPEHPYTLEQLSVVEKAGIEYGEYSETLSLSNKNACIKYITVSFTPTVPHCSMAGVIGLCIKFQLEKYISG
ncbi:hypothetical protein ENBRE01_1912 [Enteropsectra breve]|nr:hypothetical protein ENBRE01_1912 [Enteropsectra breve]